MIQWLIQTDRADGSLVTVPGAFRRESAPQEILPDNSAAVPLFGRLIPL
jgi:hypothetical protein